MHHAFEKCLTGDRFRFLARIKTFFYINNNRADYWKSQDRIFCDFCKCWLTDNKPVSIIIIIMLCDNNTHLNFIFSKKNRVLISIIMARGIKPTFKNELVRLARRVRWIEKHKINSMESYGKLKKLP